MKYIFLSQARMTPRGNGLKPKRNRQYLIGRRKPEKKPSIFDWTEKIVPCGCITLTLVAAKNNLSRRVQVHRLIDWQLAGCGT
jgi:hypothetical protein